MFNRSKSGFTIVELLIVIVVIGILAAVSIVAYNGVQARSQNASVQSDIRSNAVRLSLFKVDNDRPATISELSSNTSIIPKFSGTATKTASYCVADGQYAIGGQSKSNQIYYSLNGGPVMNNNSLSIMNICDGLSVTKSGGAPADSTILANSGSYTLSTQCAAEGQTCTFSGSRVIAYGANGNYIYQAATAGITCNNIVFGSDPAPGTVKACYLTT